MDGPAPRRCIANCRQHGSARGPRRPIRTRQRPNPIDRASRSPRPGDHRRRRLTARPPPGHWCLAQKPVPTTSSTLRSNSSRSTPSPGAREPQHCPLRSLTRCPNVSCTCSGSMASSTVVSDRCVAVYGGLSFGLLSRSLPEWTGRRTAVTSKVLRARGQPRLEVERASGKSVAVELRCEEVEER
jgi:hypothetical protein